MGVPTARNLAKLPTTGEIEISAQTSHGSVQRTVLALAFAGPLALNACAPVPGQDQVAVRFYPPPWKNQLNQQSDETFCEASAGGYVRVYVDCMRQRGYRPEIIGPGGTPMTAAQLPVPPTGVGQPAAPSYQPRPPTIPPRQPPPEQRRTGPTHHLSQSEVARLIEICPGIPRGFIRPGPPRAPGSLAARKCEAFEPVYKASGTGFGLAMMFGGVGPGKLNAEHLRLCLRNGYDGPRRSRQRGEAVRS